MDARSMHCTMGNHPACPVVSPSPYAGVCACECHSGLDAALADLQRVASGSMPAEEAVRRNPVVTDPEEELRRLRSEQDHPGDTTQ